MLKTKKRPLLIKETLFMGSVFENLFFVVLVAAHELVNATCAIHQFRLARVEGV